jgi:hypothetical protein
MTIFNSNDFKKEIINLNISSMEKLLKLLKENKNYCINLEDNEKLNEIFKKNVIISFFIKSKLSKDEIVKIFNDNNEIIFKIEYISIINNYKNEKKTIEDLIEEDKNILDEIAQNDYFNNCETSTIEVVKSNAETTNTVDIKTMLEDSDIEAKKINNIASEITKLLKINKNSNINITNKQINEIINSKLLIPITDEFMIINDQKTIKIDPKQKVNKIDIIFKQFHDKINNEVHDSDFYINQIEVLQVLNKYLIKYKDTKNIEIINNINILKTYFNQVFLNYSINKNSLDFKNTKQFISLRKLKLNDKINTRLCPVNSDIKLVGFALLNDKITEDKIIELNELLNLINNNELNINNDIIKTHKYIYLFNVENSQEIIDKIYKTLKNVILNSINIEEYLTEYGVNYKKIKEKYQDFNITEDDILRQFQEQIDITLTEKKNDLRDENETKTFGLEGNIVKLPEVKIEKLKKLNNLYHPSNNNIFLNTICQHVIDQQNINNVKNSNNISKYETLIHNFIAKYVETDNNNNKICKKCHQLLDTNGLTLGSNLENDTIIGSLLSHGLEKFEGYTEFGRTNTSDGLINNVDSTISDIGNILNFKNYSGFSTQAKSMRQKLIKDIIDIIRNVKNVLVKKYNDDIKIIIPDIIKKYNVLHSNYNNFYIFPLDNEIYETTKQDIFQLRKRNNIIYYILFYLLININDSSLLDMISVNKKIPLLGNAQNIYQDFLNHKNLFECKINIRNKLEDIQNYPILCFCIYFMSRVLSQEKYKTKINLNNSGINIEYKKGLSIVVQLIIITSLLTLINCIIDGIDYINLNKDQFSDIEIQIWNNILTRFNANIDNGLYKNEDILKEFFNKIEKTTKYNTEKIIKFQDPSEIKDQKYLLGEEPNKDLKNKIPNPKVISFNKIDINNQNLQHYEYTNIKPSENHLNHTMIFDNKENIMKCKICGLSLKDYEDNGDHKEMKTKVEENYLNIMANDYCPSGTVHDYDIKTMTCKVCGYKINSKITNKNKEKLYNNLSKGYVISLNKYSEFKNKKKILNTKDITKSNNEIIKNIQEKLTNIYGEYLDINEYRINIINNEYQILKSAYNDNNTELENVNAEISKSNKKYIYEVTDKAKNIIYYDYIDLKPLGFNINKSYTEINYETDIVKYDKYLQIKYSIIEIIKNLLYKNKNILFENENDLLDFVQNFKNQYKEFFNSLSTYLNQTINKKKLNTEFELNNDKNKELNNFLILNNLYFDIRKYYNKITEKDLDKIMEKIKINDNIDLNLEDLINKKIEFNKVYNSFKIIRKISKLNNIYNNYLTIINLLLETKNKYLIEFVLYYIYYFFNNKTDYNRFNNSANLLFEKYNSPYVINPYQSNKLLINNYQELLEDNEEILKDIENKNMNDDDFEEKEFKKEELKDEEEGYEMEDDDEDEDDKEYEDNDK